MYDCEKNVLAYDVLSTITRLSNTHLKDLSSEQSTIALACQLPREVRVNGNLRDDMVRRRAFEDRDARHFKSCKKEISANDLKGKETVIDSQFEEGVEEPTSSSKWLR
jgi:hypothetical protein